MFSVATNLQNFESFYLLELLNTNVYFIAIVKGFFRRHQYYKGYNFQRSIPEVDDSENLVRL